MDPQFANAIKEEILRNILKTHCVTLVIGRPGTGKTATSLRSGMELGSVYYMNGTGSAVSAGRFAEGASVLKHIKDFDGMGRADALLIADDVHALDNEEKAALGNLLSSEAKSCKIILIAPVVMDARDFIPSVDVVVRFRPDTAEMVVSNLRDVHQA